MDNKW
jgi:hypothetical protein